MRDIICPDKLNTAEWLSVMDAAHSCGLNSTATIMFGHVETYDHIAEHLINIKNQQIKSGGFTEFVPLPFVAHEAPMSLRGNQDQDQLSEKQSSCTPFQEYFFKTIYLTFRGHGLRWDMRV